MEAAGSSERVDHRTLVEQGINEIALPFISKLELRMEEQGIKTKKIDLYIEIENYNSNSREIEQITKYYDHEGAVNKLKLAKNKKQLIEESGKLPVKGIEKNAKRFIDKIEEFIREMEKEMEKNINIMNYKMRDNEKIEEEMKRIYYEVEGKSENDPKKKIFLFGKKRNNIVEIIKKNLGNQIKQLNERKEALAEYYSRELTGCRLGIYIYKQLAEEIQAKQYPGWPTTATHYEQTKKTEVKQSDTTRKTGQKENQKIPEVMVIKGHSFPEINEFIRLLREGTPHFIESNGKIIVGYPNELDKNDYYLTKDGTAKLKNIKQKEVGRHDTKKVATTEKTDYLVDEDEAFKLNDSNQSDTKKTKQQADDNAKKNPAIPDKDGQFTKLQKESKVIVESHLVDEDAIAKEAKNGKKEDKETPEERKERLKNMPIDEFMEEMRNYSNLEDKKTKTEQSKIEQSEQDKTKQPEIKQTKGLEAEQEEDERKKAKRKKAEKAAREKAEAIELDKQAKTNETENEQSKVEQDETKQPEIEQDNKAVSEESTSKEDDKKLTDETGSASTEGKTPKKKKPGKGLGFGI